MFSMRFMSVFLFFLLLLLTGCETTPDNTTSPASAAVSSIPWNKPASWEGSGALGGFSPQGGH
ncbi:MAG: hypothetical protein DVB30_03650 [Verrucomicrobia bacterium]|nr:MAG: hypothetical protein DVB30_03650 [Verrucomicrobiota bacterium]